MVRLERAFWILLVFACRSASAGAPAATDGQDAFVALQGADAGAQAFEANGPTLRQAIELKVLEPGKSRALTISMDPFLSADGQEGSLGFEGEDGKITPTLSVDGSKRTTIDLVICGALEGRAPYMTRLRIVSGEVVQRIPFKITRTLPDYSVMDGKRFSVTSLHGEAQDAWITVQAPASELVVVSAKPLSLSLLTAKGETSATLEPKMTFFVGDAAASQPITVDANDLKTIRVNVAGLTAGIYEGQVRLFSPGRAARDAKFTIVSRVSWFWALVFILAGALISWQLKSLANSQRPRLVVREAVAKLQWQIQTMRANFPLTATQLEVLGAIAERIAKVYEEAVGSDLLASDWATSSRTALLNEKEKLQSFPNWVNASNSLEGLPADQVKVFQSTLDSIGGVLRGDAPLVANNRTSLSDAIDKIRDLKQKVLSTSLQQLDQQIDVAAANTRNDKDAQTSLGEAKNATRQASVELQSNQFVVFAALFARAHDRLTENAPRVVAGAGPAAASPFVKGQAALTQEAETVRQIQRGSLTLRYPATDVIEDTTVLGRRITRVDRFIDAAAIVAALAFGFLLVWTPNETWGQLSDFAAAFLWGLGLHQIGNASFQGLAGLSTSLTGAATAPARNNG